jgi:hypothetical protein
MFTFQLQEIPMPRLVIVLSILAVGLMACAPDARDLDCALQAQGSMRWGYYPGYGCGPVPRAQTVFS